MLPLVITVDVLLRLSVLLLMLLQFWLLFLHNCFDAVGDSLSDGISRIVQVPMHTYFGAGLSTNYPNETK